MGKPFTVNVNRFDPYKSYRFLVYFGTSTSPVAAVSKVGSLKRSSEAIDYKSGGDPIIRKGLGRMKYEPITLERGLTQDNDFIIWADTAQKLDQGIAGAAATSLKNLRREIRIQLLNEEGQPVHGRESARTLADEGADERSCRAVVTEDFAAVAGHVHIAVRPEGNAEWRVEAAAAAGGASDGCPTRGGNEAPVAAAVFQARSGTRFQARLRAALLQGGPGRPAVQAGAAQDRHDRTGPRGQRRAPRADGKR